MPWQNARCASIGRAAAHELSLRRSNDFLGDFDHQYRWYLAEASEVVARRYLDAVWATIEELTAHPGVGRLRRFRHPALHGLRSFRVRPPFDVHLIFYRYTDEELSVERLMSGRRDLVRRLRESPGAASD